MATPIYTIKAEVLYRVADKSEKIKKNKAFESHNSLLSVSLPPIPYSLSLSPKLCLEADAMAESPESFLQSLDPVAMLGTDPLQSGLKVFGWTLHTFSWRLSTGIQQQRGSRESVVLLQCVD